MAFETKNLGAVGYANGFTLWHYRTTADALAALDTTGYFNAAAGQLRVSDLIIADGSDGKALLHVNANAAGVVDTANFLQVGATDTD